MKHKETHLKLRLLDMLNDEYELLESNPYEEDRVCILTRIKLIEEILADIKLID